MPTGQDEALRPSLRRAQYNAQPVEVAREILRWKLAASIAVRPKLGRVLAGSLDEIATATTLSSCA